MFFVISCIVNMYLLFNQLFKTVANYLCRKLTPPGNQPMPTLQIGPDYYGHTLLPVQMQNANLGADHVALTNTKYKSLKTPLATEANETHVGRKDILPATAYPLYENGGGSDGGNSIQYYVLEDGNTTT